MKGCLSFVDEKWYLFSKDPPAWGCFSACFPTNPEESWFGNHPKTFSNSTPLSLLLLKVGLGLLLYRV